MLSETATAALTPEEAEDRALRNRRRVEVDYTSAVGSMQMILENRERIAGAGAAAAERATREGAEQSGIVYFAGQDDQLPFSANGVEPEPMCGYALTAAQIEELAPTLRVHGITWEPDGAGAVVSMAQPDRPLILLLLDARYPYRLTEAEPLDSC